MRLVVPYSGELNTADARLVRLAEFLGARCELLRLESGVALSPELLDEQVRDKNCCFVINPDVIRGCVSSDSFPPSLASYVTSQFSFVFIHNLSGDSFTASIVATFSEGSLRGVRPVEEAGREYEICTGREQVCGAFSGLNFGPVNPTNDRVFIRNPDAKILRTHIAIGGEAFLASVQREHAEVFFLAGAEIADLDADQRPESLTKSFSQLIPPAMIIRYAFSEACWRPNQPHATLIIDDPLLRKDYGFLNFETVLGLMDEYNFHTSIAFIPYNWRRNARGIIRMFRERPDRYSICFHGNDHTAAEFAAKEAGLLNAMLTAAEKRMDLHRNKTGIECDRVMVFPQGNFSREAMDVLRAHNFCAAVNSGPYPRGENVRFTLREVIEPAIVKYGGFPLFLRKYVGDFGLADIAFNLFFGKPLLIVEHHNIFKNPESLTQLVSRIQLLAPVIRWSNLQTSVENAYVRRRDSDGTFQVRAYSNAATIENASDSVVRYSVEWRRPSEFPVEKVLCDGAYSADTRSDENGIRICFELPAGESRRFSAVYRNDFALTDENSTFQWKAKVFFRRRLSELRDNRLSKSPRLLSAAKALQRRLLKSTRD